MPLIIMITILSIYFLSAHKAPEKGINLIAICLIIFGMTAGVVQDISLIRFLQSITN